MFEFADRLWRFLFRTPIDDSIESLAGRLKFTQRLLVLILIVFAAFVFISRKQLSDIRSSISFGTSALMQPRALVLDPRLRGNMEQDLAVVRPRLATIARRWIAEERPASSGFLWGIAQLVAAAPAESAAFQHLLVTNLLNGQDRRGWWSVALDATGDDANGGVPSTSLSVMALDHLAQKRLLSVSTSPSAASAIRRGQEWLAQTLKAGWDSASDYPDNSRRTRHAAFAAMASSALVSADLSPEFRLESRNPLALTPNVMLASGAFITRKSGETYIDRYRQVPYAWYPTGLAAAYPKSSLSGRSRIGREVTSILKHDITGDELARQEWMLAEIVFAHSMLLDFTKPSRN